MNNESSDQHSVRGFEHNSNPQHAVVDKNCHSPPVNLASTAETRRFEALFKETDKYMQEHKNMDEIFNTLLGHLGSELEVHKYIDWILSHPLKRETYILEAPELAKHIEKADWMNGNSSLRRLNSILKESIYSIKCFSEDFNRRFNGTRVGFQIFARPTRVLRADVEDYEDYFVHYDFLKAVGFVASPNDFDRFRDERTTMIFTPLGK